MEDLTILDVAFTYSGIFSWTSFRSLRFPGAFFGTLPFPITTVLVVGTMVDDEDDTDGIDEELFDDDGCTNFEVRSLSWAKNEEPM